MFGIKTKVYNIIALVFAGLGPICLGLKVCGVLPLASWEGVIDKTTMTLIALILYLIGIVFYIRPKMKKLKKMQEYTNKFRNDLYNEITKGNKIPETVIFNQNEEGLLQTGKMVFSNLSFGDAVLVMDNLMKDYVMIVYGVLDEKKRKITVSKKEYFEYKIINQEGKEVVRKLIENNEFLK